MSVLPSARAALVLAAALAVGCRQRPDFNGGASIGMGLLRQAPGGVLRAADGWGMVDSATLGDGGEAVSQPGYSTAGWYPVSLPSTVLGALAADGVYPDLYQGKNLGTVDPAQFAGSWWFRMEFMAPDSVRGAHVVLHLDRINYRANVWLDGRRIASAAEIAGTFHVHELDVTYALVPGAVNALAIEVFPPDLDKDLAESWIDWNPPAPDSNMGIPGEVYFSVEAGVAVRSLQVTSALEVPSFASAALTVRAEVANNLDAPVDVTVAGSIEAVGFSQAVTLAAREVREVVFAPGDYPQLVLQAPRVWWPAQMGAQERYQLALDASAGAAGSAHATLGFGIRSVTSEITASGALQFRVNGRSIQIRGAGWSPDLLLRQDPARLEAELAYVRQLGLNAIRLEGHLESDRFFELCDQLGILVLAGWQCCDAWQDWANWGPEQNGIARDSMLDQARRLRNHPSVIDFLLGSDAAPPPEVEAAMVQALQQARWPNAITSSANSTDTPLLGASGLKMTGPYQWVAPSYWSLDTQGGGAFGFNSETGPGAAIPKLPAVQKMLDPVDQAALWGDGHVAQYHAGGGAYADLSIFNEALRARYGAPGSLDDYVLKAQVMQYEAERALFEAFGRNQAQDATGVIHWKLNSAWPSLIWNLYDADLIPAGAFFGVKKANEPLHIQFSYDDRSVVVLNRGNGALAGLLAKAVLYGLGGETLFSAQAAVDLGVDEVRSLFAVPAVPSQAAFLKLSLLDANGQAVSDNVYWLSATAEVFNDASDRWYAPETTAYADFTSLRDLPLTAVTASGTDQRNGEDGVVKLQLANPSAKMAFFLQLELIGADGAEVAPVLWDDNDLTLLPGESRALSVRYHVPDLRGAQPMLRVSGWNVAPVEFPLPRAR